MQVNEETIGGTNGFGTLVVLAGQPKSRQVTAQGGFKLRHSRCYAAMNPVKLLCKQGN